MNDTPTPGERCYTAWFATAGLAPVAPFSTLRDDGRACWEAAAQAVFADALRHVLAVQAETRSHVRAVVNHWHEFGPEYGFAETLHRLETWLETHEAAAQAVLAWQ